MDGSSLSRVGARDPCCCGANGLVYSLLKLHACHLRACADRLLPHGRAFFLQEHISSWGCDRACARMRVGVRSRAPVALAALVAILLASLACSVARGSELPTCNVPSFRLSPALLGEVMGNGMPPKCRVSASTLSPPSECIQYTRLVSAALQEADMACPLRAAAYLTMLAERVDSLR